MDVLTNASKNYSYVDAFTAMACLINTILFMFIIYYIRYIA